MLEGQLVLRARHQDLQQPCGILSQTEVCVDPCSKVQGQVSELPEQLCTWRHGNQFAIPANPQPLLAWFWLLHVEPS